LWGFPLLPPLRDAQSRREATFVPASRSGLAFAVRVVVVATAVVVRLAIWTVAALFVITAAAVALLLSLVWPKTNRGAAWTPL
jgi:hypothetical protein